MFLKAPPSEGLGRPFPVKYIPLLPAAYWSLQLMMLLTGPVRILYGHLYLEQVVVRLK